jgi:hypothetical protein
MLTGDLQTSLFYLYINEHFNYVGQCYKQFMTVIYSGSQIGQSSLTVLRRHPYGSKLHS